MKGICVRCKKASNNFPKPQNPLCCGDCLHETHKVHRDAETKHYPRGL